MRQARFMALETKKWVRISLITPEIAPEMHAREQGMETT